MINTINTNMKTIIFVAMLALMLVSCGSKDDNDSDNDQPAQKKDVNVAASANGAKATSTYNSAKAGNIIDGKDDTTWDSTADTPIIIEFASKETIQKFTVKFVPPGGGMTSGTTPDILIEFSADGTKYTGSGATYSGSPNVPCTNSLSSASSGLITCKEFYSNDVGYETKFMKITTQNGKTFTFKEVEAIAYK